MTVITPPVVIETVASGTSQVVPALCGMLGAPAPSVPAMRVIRTVCAAQLTRNTIRSMRVDVVGVGIVTVTATSLT